jgi:hypothetical protein
MMGLVTMFRPARTTGAGELVVQTTGETRFVVDCKVNPVWSYPALLVGQLDRTLGPEGANGNREFLIRAKVVFYHRLSATVRLAR